MMDDLNSLLLESTFWEDQSLGSDIISKGKRTGGLRLSPEFSFVETPDGTRTSFTRSERLALAALARRPNHLLTRDQILDAIGGQGSDKSDRNVDFLINRLRLKLNDNARDPRYIATRYGEGYIWIGRGSGIDPDYASAYLVVGPVRGFNNLAGNHDPAERFASNLCASLQSDLHAEQQVVLAPDCPPAAEFANAMPSLSVELVFFRERGTVQCVTTAREFRSGRILAIQRSEVPEVDLAASLRSATETAKHLLAHTWRTLAMQTEAGIPLPVLMHMASAQPDHDRGSPDDSNRHLNALSSLHANRAMTVWKENETRLRSLREASPDDAALKIMYATQIHSKYISMGSALFQAGIDDRVQDEDDIEALVLDALPFVQSQSEYVIMAAKLLHFLDRGYFDLALKLSEEAYASSVSAVGSLSIIGQMRAFAGDTEAGLNCIDQALNLITPGSRAHLYAITIKMQILLAVADFERLDETKRELYSISAATMIVYELMFANPDKLTFRAKAMAAMLSRRRAWALLMFIDYVSARLFRNPAHRVNIICTPLTLVVGRFDKTCVPEEIAIRYAGLLARFR